MSSHFQLPISNSSSTSDAMDINLIIMKAQEQLRLVMEVPHRENSLQHWVEKTVKAWLTELDIIMALYKAVVEKALEREAERVVWKARVAKVAGEAVEELQLNQIQVSSGFSFNFHLLTWFFSSRTSRGW